MTCRRHSIILTMALIAGAAIGASGQGANTPQEVNEMRRRLAVIRAELPAITAAAEDAADRLTRNPQSRILISKSWDKSFFSEILQHGGGPVGLEDADESQAAGIVLLPVRSWDGAGLRTSMFADRQLAKNRLTIIIGSTAGAPSFAVGQRKFDNGATDGSSAGAAVSALANNVVAWTFLAELVAATSRSGWHPGILLNALAPGSDAANAGLRWRMPDSLSTHRIPAGQLGAGYLDEADRVLQAAAAPERVTAVTRAANALRSVIRQGGGVYMGSCMHWLIEELPASNSAAGAVHGFDWRWDTEKILGDLTTPKDALVWFGYGGTDCPHIQPGKLFHDLNRPTAVVAGPETAKADLGFLWISQAWRLPDAAVSLPFPPGRMGPVSTLEAGVTWLWLKRLLSQP